MRFTEHEAGFNVPTNDIGETIRGNETMSNFSDLIAHLRTKTIDDLEGFDKQAALDAGINNAEVSDWKTIHDTYFGSTRCTRRQRVAVKKARVNRIPLSKLAVIERLLRHVQDEAERWRYRHELLDIPGRCDTLRRKAKGIVPAKERKAPKPGVRFSLPRDGQRQMLVTAPERLLADVEFALRHGLGPNDPVAETMLERLTDILRGDGGVAPAAPQPYIPVPVDEAMSIVNGGGDDIVLKGPHGATMTGAEFLESYLAGGVLAGLFHPVEGAVNLYRTERFANPKQRALASMVQPECAQPWCHLSAELCDIHHVEAWKHGGETNLGNLAPLCRYHNRVNDDNPNVRQRGRIEMVTGRPTWVSPRGYAIPSCDDYGAMQFLFGDQESVAPDDVELRFVESRP